MKKSILSVIMCLCMIMTLVPFSVFAEDSANVTNGYYDNAGVWQAGGNGTSTYVANDGTKLSLSKTAEDKGNNTFEITLGVTAESSKQITPPGAAATVLVMDVSGSMEWCSGCGNEYSHSRNCTYYKSGLFVDNSVQDSQRRLSAAKTAAINFLDSYKGAGTSTGRYVAIVKFSTLASVSLSWVDVSTTEGYNAAKTAINGLKADGGTNLEQGLTKANNLFSNDAVKNIGTANRYVVALTDGVPTYYGTKPNGDGGSGSSTTNTNTAAAATTLKNNATVYTVCFGAANDSTYYGGPKVGVFLSGSIASSTDKAYDAADADELYEAFANISSSIESSIGSSGDGAFVTDPMGMFVSVGTAPENFLNEDSGYKWSLESVEPEENASGGVTTYTYSYTLKYTVTLDTDAEGFDETVFHPANGETTLTWPNGETFEFPVPGIKGETSRYTVTYLKGENGILDGSKDSVKYENIKKWSATVTEDRPTPEVTADEGYYFIGWEPAVADKVTGNATYVAQYAPQTEVVITGDSKTVDYNGSEQSVATYKVAGVDASALSGISYIAKGTDAGTYKGSFSGTPVITIDGKNVTEQYKFTYKTGELVVNKLDVTLTSSTDSKTYDGKALTCEEVTAVGFVEGEGAAYSNFASITEVGGVDNTFDYALNEGTKAVNYNITVVNGKLTVAPLGGVVVTVTENSGEYTYDGTEKTVEGYVVKSISDPLYTEADFAFNGEAVVKGTVVGTYDMEVVAADFVNNNKNFKEVTFVVEDGQLVINPLGGVVVTVTENSGEYTYDGTEKTVEGYVVKSISNPLYTEADFAFNGEAVVKGTVVGTYDMEVAAADFVNNNKNFKEVTFVVEDGQLVIKPIETEIVVKANDASKVYDGTALTDAGFSYTQGILTEGDVLTAVVEGSQTDAGSSANVVSSYKVMRGDADVTNCYTFGDCENGVLQVTKRPVTLTSGTDSKTYDGKALTCEEVSAEGFVEGEGAAYSNFASITEVGSVDNTFKYALNEGTKEGNYNITVANGKLTVAPLGKVVVTITENSGKFTYDGTEKTVEGYSVSISDPLYTEADFAFNGEAAVKGTVVGTYDMELAPENFSNTNANFVDVRFVVVDGQLVIEPVAAEITITTEGAEKVYDGTALTNDVYSFTDNVLAEGDELVVVIAGSQTNAGSSANSIESYKVMRGDVDVTDCYTFAEPVEGTLTVTPKAVTITSGSASKEYDGKALTCDKITAEGFVDGEGAKYTVTGSQTEVGSSKNTFEYALNENTLAENYDITVVYGNLVVTPEEAPKTGDDSNNALWAWLMSLSAAGAIGIVMLRKKEDEEA